MIYVSFMKTTERGIRINKSEQSRVEGPEALKGSRVFQVFGRLGE
jgi:hypothetical protein